MPSLLEQIAAVIGLVILTVMACWDAKRPASDDQDLF